MNTFNKKSLCVALATAGALGAGAAQAVSVNPDGLGQVLIYPYYTTQSVLGSPYNSLLSVVNTTSSTKAVKVRMREGKASAEVLDFNVFLSPFDVWTAAIVPDAADSATPTAVPDSAGAKIISTDNSCTIPNNKLAFAAGIPFRDLAYKNDIIEEGAQKGGIARTREGYVEIIEMATYGPLHPVSINALHGATGIPKDCNSVTDAAASFTNADGSIGPKAPGGGLSGGMTLVNVLGGLDMTVDATALANWRDSAIYSTTGSESPSLADVSPVPGATPASYASLSTNAAGNTVYATWDDGAKAVSAPLMKNAVINEFVLDSATLSSTSWVVTFPTKHLFVDEDLAFAPFQNPLEENGACDAVAITDYNREEAKRTVGGPDFSPSPTPEGTSICWEANVLAINGGNTLGSRNKYDVGTVFQNGWMHIQFGSAPGTGSWIPMIAATTAMEFAAGAASATDLSFTGLPVVGFAVETFSNGTLTDASNKLIQSTYGGSFNHKYVAAQPARVPAP